MVYCSVSHCGNSSTTSNYANKGITFHRFPQNPDVKEKWISATGKRNWFPTNYSRICSAHFNNDDFNLETKRRTLFKTAVPSVNAWNPLFSPDNRKLTAPAFKEAVPDTPRKKQLRAIVQRHKQIIATQKLKIKSLQCKVRRYRKKILQLQDQVKELKDEQCITVNLDPQVILQTS